MNYHNIDLIIEICSDQFKNYSDFINDVNQHLSENWILLNIEYDREPRVSTIVSYTLGRINHDFKINNNTQDFSVSHHEIALQLATLYIQNCIENNGDLNKDLKQICQDFCFKYLDAISIIENLNNNNIVNIK